MAVIDELIREEETGALSFGNFALATKTKKDGFQYQGDSYKIKTFREITKLERNGMWKKDKHLHVWLEMFWKRSMSKMA